MKFLTQYIKSLPKLILTNLIFSVPFTVFSGVLMMVYRYYSSRTVIFLLMLLFCYPFYGGITLVTRELAKSNDDINVIRIFFRAIKENYMKFIIQGAVLCVASFITYISFISYMSMAAENPVFYIMDVFTFIVVIFFCFMYFYLPSMTVSFDIKQRHAFKNSALMAIFEIKNNFSALIVNIIFMLLCSTILITITDIVMFVTAFLILAVLFMPSTVSFTINYFVHKKMVLLMTEGGDKPRKKEREIVEEKKENDIKEAPENIDIKGDPEEFIFHKGKMVKRAVLQKEAVSAASSDNKAEQKRTKKV